MRPPARSRRVRRGGFAAADSWNSPEVVAGLRLLDLGLQAGSREYRRCRQIRVHEGPRARRIDEGKSEEREADLRLLQDTARAPGVLAAKDEALSNAYILTARSSYQE